MTLKNAYCFFLILLTNTLFSQQEYLDSVATSFANLPNAKKTESVLNIPFDKVTSNINTYYDLTKQAIKVALKNNDSITLAKLYNKQALVLHFTSKDTEAINLTLKAIAIFEKLKDTENIGVSYLNLGWKLKNRDLNRGFSYMKKGIEVLEKEFPNSKELIGGYNNFGVLYQMKKKLDSAIFFHKKSLFLSKKANDSIGIPFAQTHIAEVYLKQQKFKLAQQYLENSLKIRKKRNDIYGITDSYLYLGDLFFEKHQFTKAIFNYKKGYDLAKKHHYFPLKKYATQYLHKSYDSLKSYKKSIHYYRIFNKMKDSILNKNTNNKIAELEIEFLTLTKDKKIAQQKEELISKQLAIKTKNLYTILLAGAFLILGIISFGFYKRNQLKRKQLQKEIDLKDALSKIKTQNRLQEQRLRISRDLHDNIGSQLTFIISSIDNLKFITQDASSILKTKLATISSFTSETISQLRDTIWAMNKNEITFEDLHTRILAFVEKAKIASPKTKFTIKDNTNVNGILSSIKGMHLFRVIQEAINNAVKYADASEINIKATVKNNELTIFITDNGKGFDLKTVTLGNGLSNMEQRMGEIEGKIFIASTPTKGTVIKITCNL